MFWFLKFALGRKGCLGTREPDTKPQPDMKQRILFSPRHGRQCKKLVVFCRFQTMIFNAPSITDVNPTCNKHGKHNTIRSSPNMKPKTQCETTAYLSFISSGSAISPDTKHTRHETTSSLVVFQLQQLSRCEPGMSLLSATTMLFHVGFGFIGGCGPLRCEQDQKPKAYKPIWPPTRISRALLATQCC